MLNLVMIDVTIILLVRIMNNTLCQGFSVHFSGNCFQVLSRFLELESILAELESNLGELKFFWAVF